MFGEWTEPGEKKDPRVIFFESKAKVCEVTTL